ncbi:MAG: hypothetical protein KGL29_07220 [Alphaproteobacteria bacterium]|nr:hypothetical protein [Alphaproteobacteria bacterium]MDE2164488.1 hypothetical protein [Alphaproteobacteria bacterium]MDE2265673.1 hypothetical protein [Alphaproteobacteria bacterium]MDE2498591.1 hypothetical protein [Alphaproteobacteria bacterium]
MKTPLLAALGISAAMLMSASGPASATDLSSLSGFLSSCQTDTRQCEAIVSDIVLAARSNHYACMPRDLSTDEAINKEMWWLQTSAKNNPQFAKMDLQDVLWTGVSDLWPCNKKA